jgi:alcohol dehydrogenase (cytochrome c)
MFYVCAQSGVTGNVATPNVASGGKKNGVAQIALGGTLTLAGGFGQNAGTFTAIDATTGKIVWQKRWPEACYAGSTTTKGNLVFIGRNDGRLHAFNATNGTPLWSFQTGAGANDAPTVFRHNGKEYVTFYAGGNALAASPHGDNLWLFALDGSMNEVAAPGAGQGVEHAGETENPNKKKGKQTAAAAGSAAAGKAVFADNCSTCHGAQGTGGNGGPDLTKLPAAKNLQRVIAQVTNGSGGMPAFKGTLTSAQIRDVATFVTKNITNK